MDTINKILINGIEYAVEDSSSRSSVAAINNQILTINDSITGINTSIAAPDDVNSPPINEPNDIELFIYNSVYSSTFTCFFVDIENSTH